VQHDYNIANQLFPATRADINLLAESIATNNLGAGFPAVTFAGQWHYNQTDDKIYLRDKANTAWLPLGIISGGVFNPYYGGVAIAQATEAVLGIIKLASPAEAAALVEATKAITAAGLATVIATAAVLGLTRYATQTEIDALAATNRSLNVYEFGKTWKFGTAIVAAGAIARPAEADRGAAYYVTGSTGINTLWAGETPGKRISLVFTGAPLLTPSANLILPGGIPWQAAAGDCLDFRAEISPAWRCISAQRYSGLPIVEPPVADQTAKVAIFQDQKASGTDGGTATAGSWITRTLQTVVENNIPGCSLAANIITLPAGDYYVLADGAFYGTRDYRQRIYNNSDAVQLGRGINGTTGGGGVTHSQLVTAAFSLASPKGIALQYRCGIGQASNGLGNAASIAGEVETFASVTVIKQG
jgi:hypothetical protein